MERMMDKRLASMGMVLLVLLVAAQGYQIYSSIQAAQQNKALALLMMDLMAEQQRVAAEYQLQILEIVAVQNAQIMELLVGIE